MNKTLKYSLFGCGGLLLVGILIIVAFSLSMSVMFGGKLDQSISEGTEFGGKTNKRGCIAEGLARATKLGENASLAGATEINSFVAACLKSSAPDAEFCRGVPSMSEEFSNNQRGAIYDKEECRRSKFKGAPISCEMVFSAKQQHCWSFGK